MKRDDIRGLTSAFVREYGSQPEFSARAPGRVNLIGEHTDYNGCPVLPMALEQCFTAVFAPVSGMVTPGKIAGKPAAGEVSGGKAAIGAASAGITPAAARIFNTDPGFPKRQFRLEAAIPSYESGDWGNYVKAGFQAILDYAANTMSPGAEQAFFGVDAIIASDIPAAAGLSSSSALVVLSGLMFMTALGLSIPKERLAQVFADGERYVGTQGGGMDQAVCILSEEGKALKIDFNPFAVRAVEMPSGYSVVVMDSTVQAEKSRTAMDRYNLRTIECRLGTAVLRESFKRRFGREVKLELLGDMTSANLGIPEEDIIPFAVEILSGERYGLAEAAKLLDVGAEVLAQNYCKRRDGSILPEPAGGFKLMQRVLHVLTEWRRVEDSAACLAAGDAAGFGRLMNGSHESCRRLYEISCPELDILTAMALEQGALGARLTGAGFGGCAVALVRDDELAGFMSAIGRRYYADFLKLPGGDFSRYIFVCRSGGGAGVGKL